MLRKGEFDAAIDSYETSRVLWIDALTEESGKLAPVYPGLGECYIEKEDFKKAIQLFLKSLELNEGNIGIEIEVRSHLGECCYFSGDMERAEKFFLESVELIEQSGEAGTGAQIAPCLNLALRYSF